MVALALREPDPVRRALSWRLRINALDS